MKKYSVQLLQGKSYCVTRFPTALSSFGYSFKKVIQKFNETILLYGRVCVKMISRNLFLLISLTGNCIYDKTFGSNLSLLCKILELIKASSVKINCENILLIVERCWFSIDFFFFYNKKIRYDWLCLYYFDKIVITEHVYEYCIRIYKGVTMYNDTLQ